MEWNALSGKFILWTLISSKISVTSSAYILLSISKMAKNLYISLLLGLLGFVLNGPTCFAGTQDKTCERYVHDAPTETLSISKGSDVYAAQFGSQVSLPQVVSERTVRTHSYRPTSSFATSSGRRVRHLTSFSNHCSWRIFSASTPFYCTTPKLFYVYALREIIR